MTSKILYYLGLLTIITGLSSFVIVFSIVFNDGQIDAILAVSVFNSFLFIWLIIYINRFVYIDFDVENNKAQFSNIWMQKPIKYSGDIRVKGLTLLPSIYMVSLSGKWFLFLYLDDDLMANLSSINDSKAAN